MSLNGYPNGHPRKIDLDQIEDGDKIIRFLNEFEQYRNQVSLIIDTHVVDNLRAYQEQLNSLEDELNTLKVTHNEQLNRLAHDLQSQIDRINSFLNKCRLKDDPIDMPDLSEKLRKLLRELAYNLDFITRNLDILPELIGDEDLPDSEFELDKTGKSRMVKWESYFIAATSSIVRCRDIPDFYNNLSRIISNEDWYGQNYLEGNYDNASVECWYCGPLDRYLTDEEKAMPDGEEKINAAVAYIKQFNIPQQYVPKTGIDDPEIYPLVEYFESVSYDEEAMVFRFENVSSTRHLFKVIKYVK